MLMPAELAGQFFFREMSTTKPSRKIQPVCSVIRLLNSLGMKSDAITVVVFSRIQREQQLDSREYGSYTKESSRIFQDRIMKNWRAIRATTLYLSPSFLTTHFLFNKPTV